jgi:hypothetical protein
VKKTWTLKYMTWIQEHVHFDKPALEVTLWITCRKSSTWLNGFCVWRRRSAKRFTKCRWKIRAVVEALQALRGVAQLTAVTVVAELGSLSHFQNRRQRMGYSGLVYSEYPSGSRIQRGGITKTGNAHLRRVVIESAWTDQHRP